MAFTLAGVAVDRTSPVPLYYQVAQRLEEAITAGEIEPGTRLENEIALADQLGLSRPTMRRAIAYLVERGLLVRKRGVGTQVVLPKVRRPMELTSLYEDLTRDGKAPTTTVLALETVPAPDAVAHSLGVAEGGPVQFVERLRSAGGTPLAVMHNYVPLDRIVLDRESLERHGLYQMLRGAGVRLHMASQTIGARAATSAEAKMLHTSKAAPLLTMTRTAFDDDGRGVEHGTHIYRASAYSFEFLLMSR